MSRLVRKSTMRGVQEAPWRQRLRPEDWWFDRGLRASQAMLEEREGISRVANGFQLITEEIRKRSFMFTNQLSPSRLKIIGRSGLVHLLKSY